MRSIFLVVSIAFASSLRAQTYLPVAPLSYANLPLAHSLIYPNDTSQQNQKWFLGKYAGLSSGFGFFNGSSFTTLSVPLALQLNHPLNDNMVAFAGISVAPTFFGIRQTVASPSLMKAYPGGAFINTYDFGVNTRLEMGLMYINDAKTFSISGSIGVESSSVPVLSNNPPYIKNRK